MSLKHAYYVINVERWNAHMTDHALKEARSRQRRIWYVSLLATVLFWDQTRSETRPPRQPREHQERALPVRADHESCSNRWRAAGLSGRVVQLLSGLLTSSLPDLTEHTQHPHHRTTPAGSNLCPCWRHDFLPHLAATATPTLLWSPGEGRDSVRLRRSTLCRVSASCLVVSAIKLCHEQNIERKTYVSYCTIPSLFGPIPKLNVHQDSQSKAISASEPVFSPTELWNR